MPLNMEEATGCPNGCQNFEVKMEDVINAGNKHRDAAIALKEVVNSQKKKLQDYRDFTVRLQDDFDCLENEIREKEEFVQKVSRERNECQNEIKFLVEKVEMKNEDLIRVNFILEQQRELSQKVIKTLMDEKEALQDEIKEFIDKKIDTDKLVKIKTVNNEEKEKLEEKVKDLMEEIFCLEIENRQKKELLENMDIENKELRENVEILEDKSKETTLMFKEEEKNSLREELGIYSSRSHNVSIECDSCEHETEELLIMKDHSKVEHEIANSKILEAKLIEKNLEQVLSEQKFKVTSSLFELQEKENNLEEICKCRNFCRIIHKKYNWKKSVSKELFLKVKNEPEIVQNEIETGTLQKVYPCNLCELSFTRQAALKEHMRSYHGHVEVEMILFI